MAKKLLASILVICMVLSTMCFSVFADGAVASVDGNEYTDIQTALAAATENSEIVLLDNVGVDVNIPANVTFNGNGKTVSGKIYALGDITFAGHTKATNFGVAYSGTKINIGEGACLELTGTERLVIGHDCTFNIKGNIGDAKTADVATLTPSLVMPGASFTGAGVTFNVTDAYIKVPSSYCSSSKSASSTFDFNIQNSIWDQAGKLAFESQSVAATVNFNLVDSVLTTGSHLVFGVSRGEVVIDNSNVNVNTNRQIENQSTMIIKNGSVVNGAVATSSNAKNPGTIIVENAEYAVTGEFSGSDLGTGTIIVRDGAKVSAGSITNANIVIDADSLDFVKINADLKKLTGTISSLSSKFDVEIQEGVIVSVPKRVAQVGDKKYENIIDAFKAATAGCTIEILSDIVIDYKWDCRDYVTNGSHSQFKESVTINGNGHTIKFTGEISDSNWNTIFRFEENATVNDLVIDITEATGTLRVISAKKSLAVDKLTIKGSSKYGIIFGEGATADELANTEITIKNSDLSGTRRAISDNEGGKDVKSVTVTDNTLNSNVYLSAYESIVFNNNTSKAEVDLRTYTKDDKLNVTAKGNTLNTAVKNLIQANGNIDAQYDFTVPVKGSNSYAYIKEVDGYVRVWGEGGGNAKQSYVLMLYSNGDLMATTKLNNVNGIIDGDVNVTWNFFYPESNDEYWTTTWEAGHPNVNAQPTHVELYIDGELVATTAAQMNAPDGVDPVEWAKLGGVYPVATIGNVTYTTLQSAFAAAQAGETIKLIENVSANKEIKVTNNVTLDLNGKTITGTDNATGSYGLFNIQPGKEFTVNDTVGGGKITLTATNNRGWNGYSSVISNQRGKLIVNGGEIEHLGGTDMAYAIDNLTNGKGTYAETIINGGTIKSTYRAVRQFLNGTEAQNILTVNGGTITGTNKSIWMQDPSAKANSGTLTVTENATLNGDIYMFVTKGSTEWPVDVSIAATAVNGEVLTANVPDGYKLMLADGVYSVETQETLADTIAVEFELASADLQKEGEKLYDIYLVGANAEIINRLNSADLTFALNTEDKMAYEVIKVDDITVTTDADNEHRYMFNFNGKDNVVDTATKIRIAQVKVTGYGTFSLAVKADETTNEVHATKISNSIVDTFVPGGVLADGTVVGSLDLTPDTDVTDVTIEVPTRELTVKVTFPNVVVDKASTYQNMSVTISGGDLAADIVKPLGSGTNANASYTVTADLTLNTAYTVTVSGDGYRTARYTVTMTDDKTLNFWNNVMDNKMEVEEGKASSAAFKNFLAGDIVADNNINIYDLSAVVSYFTQDATENEKYIKYDLNRDGIIDSKDVAYVLVSWGE